MNIYIYKYTFTHMLSQTLLVSCNNEFKFKILDVLGLTGVHDERPLPSQESHCVQTLLGMLCVCVCVCVFWASLVCMMSALFHLMITACRRCWARFCVYIHIHTYNPACFGPHWYA